VAPTRRLGDLARAFEAITTADADALVLIGRRHLRTNNSWSHNVAGCPPIRPVVRPAQPPVLSMR
jgi:hypothetical protein